MQCMIFRFFFRKNKVIISPFVLKTQVCYFHIHQIEEQFFGLPLVNLQIALPHIHPIGLSSVSVSG